MSDENFDYESWLEDITNEIDSDSNYMENDQSLDFGEDNFSSAHSARSRQMKREYNRNGE